MGRATVRTLMGLIALIALVAHGPAEAECVCFHEPCEIQFCPNGSIQEWFIGVVSPVEGGNFDQ